ncbi:histidine phosphatase family protein [Neiella marina]|uniref:phosphoglycerate mutase (2,3-diphosphoglycerate-dependent) n=1 Tax=Neiella holothuriorum TaxID=2870530 RepID=A0ABS7EEK9_9GAMM|nr:histidine phosphatase family protein [Neiella holothuriorum]MBW8190241.1 histidine phosphatase family protein [Neiella holothuriorum]
MKPTQPPRLPPNSSIIGLIRHGDYQQHVGAPSAFQPHPLTELGQQQSQQLADSIEAFVTKWQVRLNPKWHTSVLLRAWQTATICANQLTDHGTSTLIETAQLGERCVGNLANLTTAEIEAAIASDPRYSAPPKGWKSDSDYCLPYPGAESLMMAGQRVANYINEQAMEAPANGLTLFFGHGAAFRHAAYLTGALERHQIAKLSMYHASVVFFAVLPGGQWQHIDGEWKIRLVSESFTD